MRTKRTKKSDKVVTQSVVHSEHSDDDNVINPTAPVRRSPRKRLRQTSQKQGKSASIPEAEVEVRADSSVEGGGSPPHALQTKKTRKEPVKFDRSQEDEILDFMEVNECLWNPGHGEWMKADVKEKAWKTIGAKIECDWQEIRTWWNTNKDRYVREHKKSKSGSGSKCLSARMQWLMLRLSFYSKVVTHHQLPIVSLKAQIAEREGREPSPVSDDNPDDISTCKGRGKISTTTSSTVQKVVAQMEEHLKAAEKQQRELLKPKSEQEAYGLYISTWLSGLEGPAFDNARTVINDLITTTAIKARRSAHAFTPPAPRVPRYSPVSDDTASPRSWAQDPHSSSVVPSQLSASEMWQPHPSTWRPYAADTTTPLYKTQTREYMGQYHDGKSKN